MNTENQGTATMLVLMLMVVMLFVTAPLIQKSVLLYQLCTSRVQMYKNQWLVKAGARLAVIYADRYWDGLKEKKGQFTIPVMLHNHQEGSITVDFDPHEQAIYMNCTLKTQKKFVTIRAQLTHVEKKTIINQWVMERTPIV